MRSDNQYAEALLRSYAVASGHKGSTEKAASMEKDYWRKHKAPMSGVNIIDGSGLSRQNRVTARFMAHILSVLCIFFPIGWAGRNFTQFSC